MKFSSTVLPLVAVGAAHATPVAKRAITDADILNYALTLEHLEAAFYQEGLMNYTESDFMAAGYNGSFYANLKEVASDEVSHEKFLTSALSAAGASPVERCNYTFPSTDVKSFLTLASVLEGVGVSAYLGAAAHIMNDTYLTAAGSILTVEARHSSYLRAALGEVPFAQPFDTPLDFNEVYTVASPFIKSCPSSNVMLPVKAFPSLTMMPMGVSAAGDMVTLMAGDGFNMMNTTNTYAAFVTVTGPMWTPVQSKGNGKFSVTIPKGVAGQSYVVLTRGNNQVTDDNIIAGPAIVEIGTAGSKMGTGMGMGMGNMSSWPSASMTPGASSASPSSAMFTGAAVKTSSSVIGAMVAGSLAAAAAMI